MMWLGMLPKHALARVSTRNIEVVNLPTDKFGIDIVQKELEIRVFRLVLKNWKTQVFPKRIVSLNAKRSSKEVPSRAMAIGKEENLGFDQIDLWPE